MQSALILAPSDRQNNSFHWKSCLFVPTVVSTKKYIVSLDSSFKLSLGIEAEAQLETGCDLHKL